MHSCSMLFKGSFSTKIATIQTKVDFKILNSYEVKATFTSHGEEYIFTMNRWKKPKEKTKKPISTVSTFSKFADLVLERFGDTSDKFGSVKVVGSAKTIDIGEEQVINILKYACVDVFICAEEIIVSHRRSLLDYCIYHREREIADTYERYIHLVACHCLVQSNYLAPTTKFPEVEFFCTEPEYDNKKLTKIKTFVEPSESDDE